MFPLWWRHHALGIADYQVGNKVLKSQALYINSHNVAKLDSTIDLFVNPSVSENRILRENFANIMAPADQAPCVARSSAAMVLTI